MSKTTSCWAIRLAMLAALLPWLAPAVDHFPPCWRGLPGSTFQDWEFTTTPANLLGPESVAPDLNTNATATASAAINDLSGNGSTGWRHDPSLSAKMPCSGKCRAA